MGKIAENFSEIQKTWDGNFVLSREVYPTIDEALDEMARQMSDLYGDVLHLKPEHIRKAYIRYQFVYDPCAGEPTSGWMIHKQAVTHGAPVWVYYRDILGL